MVFSAPGSVSSRMTLSVTGFRPPCMHGGTALTARPTVFWSLHTLAVIYDKTQAETIDGSLHRWCCQTPRQPQHGSEHQSFGITIYLFSADGTSISMREMDDLAALQPGPLGCRDPADLTKRQRVVVSIAVTPAIPRSSGASSSSPPPGPTTIAAAKSDQFGNLDFDEHSGGDDHERGSGDGRGHGHNHDWGRFGLDQWRRTDGDSVTAVLVSIAVTPANPTISGCNQQLRHGTTATAAAKLDQFGDWTCLALPGDDHERGWRRAWARDKPRLGPLRARYGTTNLTVTAVLGRCSDSAIPRLPRARRSSSSPRACSATAGL